MPHLERRRAALLEPAAHGAPARQPVLGVLVQVAVAQVELLEQELAQLGLGLAHAAAGERADQDHVPGADALALADERGARVGRHVLQRVAGHHQVEAAVAEGQRRAVAQDQALAHVAGLAVEARDPVVGQEAAQQAGAPAHVEDRQRPAVDAQAVGQVGHEAIALVLVDRQAQQRVVGAAAHRALSWSRAVPSGSRRRTAQAVGRVTRPCCRARGSTTSKLATRSRWSIGVGEGLEWSYRKVDR